DIPNFLHHLIAWRVPGQDGVELARAFRDAILQPPVTTKTLDELRIDNIIHNEELRLDINFDRNLSFRPNFDGERGTHKRKIAAKYWKALVAELELYNPVFHQEPLLFSYDSEQRAELVKCAQQRLPTLLETIKDILKLLIPDVDHFWIDEHWEVPKLMQEIERGVCDLVRLADLTASILKEHCAPMRDGMVDKMASTIKAGLEETSNEKIISGLQLLLGVLEAMKLDVANHQIRHLRMVLIADTIDFHREHQLKRLSSKPHVSLKSAQKWWRAAQSRYLSPSMPAHQDPARLHIEVFARAVVSSFLVDADHNHFPSTFYLDHIRIRQIKSDINDLVYYDICFALFRHMLRELGVRRDIPTSAWETLRSSITAIISDNPASTGISKWVTNSEHLAIHLVRESLVLARSPSHISLDLIQRTKVRLYALFHGPFQTHASILETYLVPRVLDVALRHVHSSPVELFNDLVNDSACANALLTPPQSPSQTAPPPSFADQLPELANRIAHLAVLHWRIWGPLAYVLE
ncbi:Tcp11-domain-containing protein, partial [Sporormia fimetaria CBS 119925]